MANLRSTPRAFERAPGIVALAGPAFGAALLVLVLFSALLTEEPTWVLGWGAGCGILLIGSGVWAWLSPTQLRLASRMGLLGGAVGLALGSPALGLWIRSAFAGDELLRPDLVVFATVVSILSACYLSFLASHLVRGERIAADERRARQAAHGSLLRPHASSLAG